MEWKRRRKKYLFFNWFILNKNGDSIKSTNSKKPQKMMEEKKHAKKKFSVLEFNVLNDFVIFFPIHHIGNMLGLFIVSNGVVVCWFGCLAYLVFEELSNRQICFWSEMRKWLGGKMEIYEEGGLVEEGEEDETFNVKSCQ